MMNICDNIDKEVMESETFKNVVGYEGLYMVSNLGRIYGVKFKHILKQNAIRGYMNICLCKDNIKKTYRVHRLIGFAFLPQIENKPYINHKNGLRHDNRLENLEWCNNSENQLHSFRKLNRVPHLALLGKTGALCKNSKKVNQITSDNKLIKTWDSTTEVQRQLGYHQSCISVACRRNTLSYGFKWQYL